MYIGYLGMLVDFLEKRALLLTAQNRVSETIKWFLQK